MMSDEDRRAYAAMRKFIFWAAGYGEDEGKPEDYDIFDAVEDATARLERLEDIERLEDRMDDLEAGWGQLVTDLPTSKRSKREKMYAVVAHAVENGKTGMNGKTISKDAAAGAAGCSSRHALNLFDDLADGFEWAEKDLRGDQARLKIDLGDRDGAAFLDAVAKEFPEGAER